LTVRVWFASGNIHKKKEIEAILINAGVPALELKVPADEGLVFEPEENGGTFLENALIKARALRVLLEQRNIFDPVLADDSGLCVEALGGRPGIFSARYGSEGGKKLSAEERNNLPLAEVGGASDRRAAFVCALVLLFSSRRFYAAQETLEGELIREGRGSGGFGYDPVLLLPGLKKTVAELTEAEKNTMSHRAKAGRALAAFLSISGQAGRGMER
jgi:XTP/dITP diphosphohydrolase